MNKSMYGTRDAAANFAAMVMEVLGKMGFKIGVFNPRLCRHETKDITLFYHGDDFVILGEQADLTGFAKELGESLIVKVRGTLGPDESDHKKITLLNRILRYGCSAGGLPFLEWEADPRHAEIITTLLRLGRAARCKELGSPGVKRTMDEVNRATDLDPEMTAAYRSICMRINYLAQDRPDLMFTAKEMARWMARPNSLAWEMAKRCGRYILGKPRIV